MDAPLNRYGGLTLVPTSGFEALAEDVKRRIEERGRKEEEKETPVDIALPRFGSRSNGEPFVQLEKEHVGDHDCVVMTSGPGTKEMLIDLLFLLRYLVGRRAARIAVVTNYFPLGRSDKDEGDLEFALPPLVVDLMLATTYGKLDRVIAFDIHSDQVVMSGRSGLITPISLVRRILDEALEDARALGLPICLAFPDDGALKRIEKHIDFIFEKLGETLPVVCGSKRRFSSRTSQVRDVYGDVDRLEGAVVLNVDDEIATGGTNANAARRYKREFGAREVWAVVTHGILCDGVSHLLDDQEAPVALDRIYAADTVPIASRADLAPYVESGRLRVITSWHHDLAGIIYRHHWGIKIREIR